MADTSVSLAGDGTVNHCSSLPVAVSPCPATSPVPHHQHLCLFMWSVSWCLGLPQPLSQTYPLLSLLILFRGILDGFLSLNFNYLPCLYSPLPHILSILTSASV